MKEVARRYLYEATHKEVMAWAKDRQLLLHHSPNNKSNFPFFLEQYIAELKWKAERRKA